MFGIVGAGERGELVGVVVAGFGAFIIGVRHERGDSKHVEQRDCVIKRRVDRLFQVRFLPRGELVD